MARLRDPLDDSNVFLVVRIAGGIAGFISITPPNRRPFSIDKYFIRAELPFAFDDRLFENRLLTIIKPHREGEVATLLMFAVLRWVESHSGTRIAAIGRREIPDLYIRVGFCAIGALTRSGAVTCRIRRAFSTRSASALIGEIRCAFPVGFPLIV